MRGFFYKIKIDIFTLEQYKNKSNYKTVGAKGVPMAGKHETGMVGFAALFVSITMAFAELGILIEVVNTETFTQLMVGWLSSAYWLTLMVFVWKGFAKNEYRLDFALMITAACCISVGHAMTGFVPLFHYAHLLNTIIWAAMAIGMYMDIPTPQKKDLPTDVR